MFGLPLTLAERKSLVLYHCIRNAEDLERCSKDIAEINDRFTRVDCQDGYVTRGTLVYTLPDPVRYRNDSTYLWNGQKLVALISTSLDDYGMTPPELQVLPGEPINLFMAPTHNSYWWPSEELRRAVCDAPVTSVHEETTYRDIVSSGKTFRFMCDETSDLQNGAFLYDHYEWFNQKETVYVGELSACAEEAYDDTIHVPLSEDIILCSVSAALEPGYETCYDEWDESE